jgi:hypothetical protein
MYSHQPSIAAAERESRNSDFGVGTTDGREAIRLGGVIDLTPARADFGADPSRPRIDAHLAHPRSIDHQTVVAYSGARAGMAAAADGGQDPALAREAHTDSDVFDANAVRDRARMAVDQSVPHASSGDTVSSVKGR